MRTSRSPTQHLPDETLRRAPLPDAPAQVRRDDKQPRDSNKPLLEKQPGSSPHVGSDDKQPRSNDQVMTEQQPGTPA